MSAAIIRLQLESKCLLRVSAQGKAHPQSLVNVLQSMMWKNQKPSSMSSSALPSHLLNISFHLPRDEHRGPPLCLRSTPPWAPWPPWSRWVAAGFVRTGTEEETEPGSRGSSSAPPEPEPAPLCPGPAWPGSPPAPRCSGRHWTAGSGKPGDGKAQCGEISAGSTKKSVFRATECLNVTLTDSASASTHITSITFLTDSFGGKFRY